MKARVGDRIHEPHLTTQSLKTSPPEHISRIRMMTRTWEPNISCSRQGHGRGNGNQVFKGCGSSDESRCGGVMDEYSKCGEGVRGDVLKGEIVEVSRKEECRVYRMRDPFT
ncbi:hypothetical protein PIB30_040577 [Stylosanthes scabra]|uniref:Uncharacterized protein n=1 Tax=Stylosanthes scabra TaxID=79078 RepID=A0ABU6YC25_9FABA|nr:hypothetical protein [Stylosanthes scabra]